MTKLKNYFSFDVMSYAKPEPDATQVAMPQHTHFGWLTEELAALGLPAQVRYSICPVEDCADCRNHKVGYKARAIESTKYELKHKCKCDECFKYTVDYYWRKSLYAFRPELEYNPPHPPTFLKPRTQKAKGVLGLKAEGFATFNVPSAQLFQNPQDIAAQKLWVEAHGTWFVRPCPVRPRHGFVESREAKTVDEIVKIMVKTLAADPKGEILLLPKIIGNASAVWLPESGTITVGPSNDGATKGYDTLTLPLLPKS